MSDGREEREEQEKRREWEREKRRPDDDRIPDDEDWVPERYDSKAVRTPGGNDTAAAEAAVARTVFDERGIAPTYPVAKAVDLRFNGPYGLRQELMLDSWRLKLVGVDTPERFPQFVPDVTAWN